MSEQAWWISDSGYYCGECAFTAVKDMLAEQHGRGLVDDAGRGLAAVRLAEPTSIRELRDALATWRHGETSRTAGALELVNAAAWTVDLGSNNNCWGESCAECGDELEDMYVTCDNCNRCDYASQFPWHDDASVDTELNDDRPTVAYCGRCSDEYVADRVELLANDGRGYRLTFAGGIYRAGCRRFSYRAAVDHWGDSRHHAPAPAALLLAAVKAHHDATAPAMFSVVGALVVTID